MRQLAIYLISVPLCFSLQDLRNAQCDIACKRAGYDSGYFERESCQCVDSKRWDDIVKEKRTILPAKPKQS